MKLVLWKKLYNKFFQQIYYLEIKKIDDAIIELDTNYIYDLQMRFEIIYEKIINKMESIRLMALRIF